jgi:hypothetical protein
MAPRFVRQIARTGRRFGPTWKYVFNARPSISYRLDRHRLSAEAERVVANLNRDGIAVAATRELFGDEARFSRLCDAAERLEAEQSARLEAVRAEADNRDRVGTKTFLVELLGGNPSLDPGSPFARFALDEQILGIANAYFGMYTRLRYYNVWHTFATRGAARESQLWHRDREDLQILKVFAYLSDVDDGAGPLTYAAGSHHNGHIKQEPVHFDEAGVQRSDDDQMAAVVGREAWVKATGPRGTIVFADTHGYHKGGLARERDRVLYTCMFTSPASRSPELFTRPERLERPADRGVAFALA